MEKERDIIVAVNPKNTEFVWVRCMNLGCRGQDAGWSGGFLTQVTRERAERPGCFIECNECYSR